MEAYVLFARGKEATVRCETEEREDISIGCASSGSSLASDEVDLADDATSSSSGSTTARFEMASLITHLPIKRGLSKFFDGKSQSFASLAAVRGLEDLPKPPPAKRLKTSRSCGVGLQDAHSAPPAASTSRARRLSSSPAPTKLMMRTRPPVTARRPEAVAVGQPLLFA